jgi:hypothetical protein
VHLRWAFPAFRREDGQQHLPDSLVGEVRRGRASFDCYLLKVAGFEKPLLVDVGPARRYHPATS